MLRKPPAGCKWHPPGHGDSHQEGWPAPNDLPPRQGAGCTSSGARNLTRRAGSWAAHGEPR
eukprot:11889312-Alexandrium_andersonii.AAC.1